MSRYDTDYVLMMVNQRRKELIKEGDQARLLKAARLEQPCQRWTSRAANWLGAKLVDWGSGLQCAARASLASIISG